MGDRTTDYNEGPIWQAFGLTRASYAVFPRRALQSMPWDWQKRMLDLINEMHDTLGSEAIDGNWTVQLRVGGKFVKDWRSDYRHAGPLPYSPPLRTPARGMEMADDKPTEELLVYICHTEHRLWVGGDYSGFWLTVRVGDTSYKRRPEMPEHYNTFIYKLQS